MSKKIFSFITLMIVLAAVIAGLTVLTGFFSGNDRAAQLFTIKSGQGVNVISDELYNQGFIKNKLIFETAVWLKNAENKLQAGLYTLPADASVRELINLFILGPRSSQRSLTFIEGWDRGREELKNLLTQNSFDYEEFLRLTARKSDWEEEYDFLADAPSSASLEGYLFPNTHFIDSQTTERDLVDKLLGDFDRQLKADLRTEIKKQKKTIFEIITLASIIEREVPAKADRKIIADIFLKRLQKGIGLQSDATINFITGKGLAQPTYEDTRVESPYNTYKYRGLPPGPIGNPGLASIEAVLYPTPNPYYYFLTTKEGEVIYSRTYDEHLANKKKYLP